MWLLDSSVTGNFRLLKRIFLTLKKWTSIKWSIYYCGFSKKIHSSNDLLRKSFFHFESFDSESCTKIGPLFFIRAIGYWISGEITSVHVRSHCLLAGFNISQLRQFCSVHAFSTRFQRFFAHFHNNLYPFFTDLFRAMVCLCTTNIVYVGGCVSSMLSNYDFVNYEFLSGLTQFTIRIRWLARWRHVFDNYLLWLVKTISSQSLTSNVIRKFRNSRLS